MIHSPRSDTSGPDDDDPPEPGPLRRLRILVTALIVVLIGGMITVAGTLVIRLGMLGEGAQAPGAEGSANEPVAATTELIAPPGAPGLTLPEGHAVVAIGRSGAEILILTRDPDGAERLRSFDATTGEERAAIPVRRAPAPSGGDDAPR